MSLTEASHFFTKFITIVLFDVVSNPKEAYFSDLIRFSDEPIQKSNLNSHAGIICVSAQIESKSTE